MISSMMDLSRELAAIDVTNTANFKAMVMVADEFRNRGLPVKYIGRMQIDVNENFFEDEDEAKEFIANSCTLIENLYNAYLEEFGEDAEQIFADSHNSFSITYQY